MEQLPQYLIEALANYGPEPPSPVEAPIAPGDIRMCEAPGGRHFVLVTDVHERHVNIALLTNLVEIASDQTPILSEAMTGMGFKLLVTNLMGPVWPHQLSGRYAQVAEIALIRRMIMGDWSAWYEAPHIGRGLPFSGRGWRWTAHEDALRDLQALCSDTLCELLGEE